MTAPGTDTRSCHQHPTEQDPAPGTASLDSPGFMHMLGRSPGINQAGPDSPSACACVLSVARSQFVAWARCIGPCRGACPGSPLAAPAFVPLHTPLGPPIVPLSTPSPNFLSSAQYWCFTQVTKDLAVLSQRAIMSLWHLFPFGKGFFLLEVTL